MKWTHIPLTFLVIPRVHERISGCLPCRRTESVFLSGHEQLAFLKLHQKHLHHLVPPLLQWQWWQRGHQQEVVHHKLGLLALCSRTSHHCTIWIFTWASPWLPLHLLTYNPAPDLFCVPAQVKPPTYKSDQNDFFFLIESQFPWRNL